MSNQTIFVLLLSGICSFACGYGIHLTDSTVFYICGGFSSGAFLRTLYDHFKA